MVRHGWKAACVFLTATLATGAVAKTLSSTEGYRLVLDLLSEDRDVRGTARDALVAAGDKSLLPALGDVVSLYQAIQDLDRLREVHRIMEKISGEKVGSDPRLGWIEWIGRHQEIKPKSGYVAFKSSIFTIYDPAFRVFLDPRSTFRIRPEEIEWGGVKKDGIPALRNPKHVSASEADYLRGEDRVFGIYLNGEARAYPHRILDWHEMSNDVVGGRAVSLSYCTLCGSGILYNGTVGADTYTFGSSGLLYRSNKLMYDHQTESLWSNLTGEPVAGELATSGTRLEMLPVVVTTWDAWRELHPETKVLDSDTGYDRDYKRSPYKEYFRSNDTMFPVWLESDLLKKKEWVFALVVNGKPKAYPLAALKKERLVHDRLGGKELVLVTEKAGGVRVYESGGREFTESRSVGELVEKPTSFTWKMTEEFLVHDTSGEKLARVPGHKAYWFGWYAFYPGTELYQPR